MSQTEKPLIKKSHLISGSVYVGIHHKLAKQLAIDELTFFSQEITPEGFLLMKPRRLVEEKGIALVATSAQKSPSQGDYNGR